MLLILGFGLFYFALGTPFTDVMGVHTATGLTQFPHGAVPSAEPRCSRWVWEMWFLTAWVRALIIGESGVGLDFRRPGDLVIFQCSINPSHAAR